MSQGDSALIELVSRDGEVVAHVLVDADDEALVRSKGRWYLTTGRRRYAAHTDKSTAGKKRVLYLHRLLLGLDFGDPLQGDHINRNPLDCRRTNLRVVPRVTNQQNVPSQRNSTSTFRGVCWDTRLGKWRAYVSTAGKYHELGRFNSEEVAAEAALRGRLALMAGAVD